MKNISGCLGYMGGHTIHLHKGLISHDKDPCEPISMMERHKGFETLVDGEWNQTAPTKNAQCLVVLVGRFPLTSDSEILVVW